MSHLPADMWRHNGFHGCIFDLRVAKSPVGPWTAVRVAAAFNVQECGRSPCQVGPNPCHNGGTCIALGATFRCECPLGWKGARCEVPSHLCEGSEKSCHPGSSCQTLTLHERETPTCLCHLGRTGTLCDQAMNITDLQFSGEGSYTSLPATRSLRRESHITLSFKPASPNGGVPDYSVVPLGAAPEEGLVAYQGCIRQIIINGIEHDLRVPDGELLRGVGLGDCDGTPCGHQVCLHGGTCTPAGDTFVCTCTQNYLGRRCQLPRACLNHQCINGAACIPIDEQLGRQKRRQKSLGSSKMSSMTYMFFNRPDGDWPEELVKTFSKEDSKIQKEGRNESASGEKNEGQLAKGNKKW
ncbi:Protein eyes shut [Portunus trituberculatus]|uniref:Protein eyes shut n=1 Tax=Portunus trituberculatus TaxID=210409 RepID=A0A5B7EVZ3_PORTR|nr:Protein eyes shut [Portunus trituberculatus]